MSPPISLYPSAPGLHVPLICCGCPQSPVAVVWAAQNAMTRCVPQAAILGMVACQTPFINNCPKSVGGLGALLAASAWRVADFPSLPGHRVLFNWPIASYISVLRPVPVQVLGHLRVDQTSVAGVCRPVFLSRLPLQPGFRCRDAQPQGGSGGSGAGGGRSRRRQSLPGLGVPAGEQRSHLHFCGAAPGGGAVQHRYQWAGLWRQHRRDHQPANRAAPPTPGQQQHQWQCQQPSADP